MARSSWGLLAAVLVVGLGTWWLLGGEPLGPTDVVLDDDDRAEEAGPMLTGRRGPSPGAGVAVSAPEAGTGHLTLTGRVETVEGQPLPGRVIEARPQEESAPGPLGAPLEAYAEFFEPTTSWANPEIVVRSGDDGTFTLSGLRHTTSYIVIAQAAADEVVVPVQFFPHAMKTSDHRIVVATGVAFRGRVVDANGDGVRAIVSMHTEGDREEGDASIPEWFSPPKRTAHDGTFTFECVPQGPLHLDVQVAGVSGLRCMPVTAGTDEVVVVPAVPGGGAVLTGTVTTARGARLPGARVMVAFEPAGEAVGRFTVQVLTDALGHYRVDAVPAGVVRHVDVLTKKHGVVLGAYEDLQIPAEGVVQADVQLPPIGRLEGIVLADDGTALSGVRVTASSTRWLARPLDVVISDGQGRFAMEGLPAGVVRLRATHAGWFRKTEASERSMEPWADLMVRGVEVDVPVDGIATGVEITLERGGELGGRVVDARGSPLADAAVRLHPDGFFAEVRELQPMHVRSDDKGRFRFSGLNRRVTWIVTASQAGALRSLPMEVDSEAFARGEVGDVVLQSLRTLVGRVLDADGTPVPSLSIALHGLDIEGKTDEEGRFTLVGVPLGSHPVEIRPVDTWRADESKTMIEARAEGHEELELVWTATQHIEGMVVDPAGTPRAAVEVSLRREGTSPWTARKETTDEDGHFAFRYITRGRYIVALDGVDQAETVAAGTADVRLVIRSAPPKTMTGVVRDPEGDLLSRVRVEAYPVQAFERDPVAADAYDTDYGGDGGSFELTIPGNVDRVTLVLTDLCRANGRRDLMQRHIVRDVPVTEVASIVAPEGLPLVGRVLGPNGAPVKAARVTVSHIAGEPQYGPDVPFALSDEHGRFKLGGFPEGEALVDVTPPGTLAPKKGVRVKPGGPDVEIRLAQGLVLEVEVLDARGAPRPGHAVQCYGPMLGSREQLTPVPGLPHRYRSKPLPPGTYTVEVEGHEDRGGARLTDVALAAAGSPVRITVPHVRWIRGRIEHAHAVDFDVSFVSPSEDVEAESRWVEDDGTFELRVPLEAKGSIVARSAEHNLVALAPLDRVRDGRVTLVPQGAGVVAGRLDGGPGGMVSLRHELGLTEHAHVDGNSFRFGGLPPGQVELTWTMYDPKTHELVEVSGSARVGDQDVVLR